MRLPLWFSPRRRYGGGSTHDLLAGPRAPQHQQWHDQIRRIDRDDERPLRARDAAHFKELREDRHQRRCGVRAVHDDRDADEVPPPNECGQRDEEEGDLQKQLHLCRANETRLS